MSSLKLYRHPLSGHSHRVQLFLSILGLHAEMINVDLANGAHKMPGFLRKNVFGQVPVLEDDKIIICDSNAILVYLASKYDAERGWLPDEPVLSAEVQRFLSIAAGKIAYGPAAARSVNIFNAGLDHKTAIITSHSILGQLENHMRNREWLVGSAPTIADIANYTFISHAPEGDVSLENYPHLRDWLKRVEKIEGFIPMLYKIPMVSSI